MPKHSIYIPDALAVRLPTYNLNVSAICQAAIESALNKANLTADILGADHLERIEVDTVPRKAFRGRHLAGAELGNSGAVEVNGDVYLTKGGSLAYVETTTGEPDQLRVFPDFAALSEALLDEHNGLYNQLLGEVAEALGEDFTIELDI